MKRIISHIILKTKTPLKVGSNKIDFVQDSPIQRDWNNLPMILGTSIAGVVRKEFNEKIASDIFGENQGSKIIFSNALLLDENNQVNEKLLINKSDFLQIFDELPIRQHTAITDKGVAREHSKFDEEIVFKGSRFKFLVEFVDLDEEIFEKVIEKIVSKTFRLGGGSTKGFGEFEVEKITYEEFDENSYSDISTSLNTTLKNEYQIKSYLENYDEYILKLTPDDFFMFGSGFGDEDSDMTAVFENEIDYQNKTLSKKRVLIPASSIKGAISHRLAFNWNIENNDFEDTAKIEEENEAVIAILGHKKERIDNMEVGHKGNVLISDCFIDKFKQKKFEHVKIDRFTGGASDGALFKEKTTQSDEFEIRLYLKSSVKEKYKKVFEKTLKEICNGLLPLGGMTTKGHGFFSGELYKNGEEI